VTQGGPGCHPPRFAADPHSAGGDLDNKEMIRRDYNTDIIVGIHVSRPASAM
jgi:hypothetical protein